MRLIELQNSPWIQIADDSISHKCDNSEETEKWDAH